MRAAASARRGRSRPARTSTPSAAGLQSLHELGRGRRQATTAVMTCCVVATAPGLVVVGVARVLDVPFVLVRAVPPEEPVESVRGVGRLPIEKSSVESWSRRRPYRSMGRASSRCSAAYARPARPPHRRPRSVTVAAAMRRRPWPSLRCCVLRC